MNTVDIKFQGSVDAFAKRGENLASALRGLVERAVRSAYSRNNLANAQYLIDNAPVSYTHLTLPTICSV